MLQSEPTSTHTNTFLGITPSDIARDKDPTVYMHRVCPYIRSRDDATLGDIKRYYRRKWVRNEYENYFHTLGQRFTVREKHVQTAHQPERKFTKIVN